MALPLPVGVPLALSLESLHKVVWLWHHPGLWGFYCSRVGVHVNVWLAYLYYMCNTDMELTTVCDISLEL